MTVHGRKRSYKLYRKTKTKVINISTSLVLIFMGLGGALPIVLTGNVSADSGSVTISNAAELRSAIENQANGQTWTIKPGKYALIPTNITAGGQTGWYFPITANDITINGVGDPTIYGDSFSPNGVWATQDLMAVFGNNVTINGLKLMPKLEPNKTIEVMGNDTTIENTVVEPNTLAGSSELTSLNSIDPTEAQWGGSIYYNGAGGTQTLDKVTINNGGISYHAAAAGVNLVFSKVTLNYATNTNWINSYRYSNHFDNPTGSNLDGTPQVVYHVSSSLGNIDDVLSNVQSGDTIDLDSNLTTSQQLALTKSVTLNGKNHTISPNFAKIDSTKNSVLSIQANNVTVNNLIENGVGGTNLHGINVYDASGVKLNNVTVENNNRTGLNVNGSKVTVVNLTTAHNGWNGADVDKTGAVLTIKGTSHQNEVSPDIYVDNSSVGQVVDANHQYSFTNSVLHAGDRVYSLKPTVPTNGQPNGGFEKTNDFYFTWDASSGGGPLTYEYQTSQNPAETNGVLTTGIWDNIANGNSEQKNLTSPQIHSVGAPDATWYWQVRAVDTHGNKSGWSQVWPVTIDTHAPAGLANESPSNGTTTTTAGLAKITWHAASDANGPVSYYYESSESSTVNKDGSFVDPAYKSGTLNTNEINTLGTAEGTYYWHVRAVDTAGNSTPWTDAWKVVVDNTPPAVPAAAFTDGSSSAKTNGGTTDSKTFTFNLSDSSSDVTRYQLKYWNSITGSAFNGENNAWNPTDVTLGGHSTNLGVYTDQFTQGVGTHYFAFSACDAAGNCSPYSDPFVVTYAVSAPSTPANTGPTQSNTPPNTPHFFGASLTKQNNNLQGNNTNNIQQTGNGATTSTSTNPDNTGHVLGDSTNTNTGHVKGDSISLTNASAKKNAAFLILGWWWAAVAAVILGSLLAIFRRRHNEN